jgi:zinc/manganese transport system permease protein
MALSICIALATIWAAIALAFYSNWPIGFFVGAFAALAYTLARGWGWGSPRIVSRKPA